MSESYYLHFDVVEGGLTHFIICDIDCQTNLHRKDSKGYCTQLKIYCNKWHVSRTIFVQMHDLCNC